MSRVDLGSVPRLRPETRYRLVDGQAVVIVQDAGEALVLNEVGSRILELIDGERSVGAIVETMAVEFAVGIDELTRDVASYLDELRAAGLLHGEAREET